MTEFYVDVVEQYKKTVRIMADTADDATEKAHKMWLTGQILLCDRDFFDVKYQMVCATNEKDTKEEKKGYEI